MARPIEQLLEQLDSNLASQIEAHESLLGLMKQKRAALANAKYQLVSDCCTQENEFVQRISEYEKRRLNLVAEITQVINPSSTQPLTMLELAQRVAEPTRGKLLVRRKTLRERIEQVQAESRVAKQATEALFGHMQGLVQSIGSLMTGVATYGRGGKRPAAATAVSTFSMTA